MNKFRRMSTQINTEKKFRQKATDSIPWVSLQKGLKEDHERMTILIQSYGWLDKQRGKKVFGPDFRAVCFPLLLYLTKHAGPKRATAAEFLAAGPRVRKDSAREDILENTSATLGLVFGSSGGKSSPHLPELRTHSQSKVHFDILSLTSTPEFRASSALKGFHEMRKEFSPFFLEI